jgi:hypothetical protein
MTQSARPLKQSTSLHPCVQGKKKKIRTKHNTACTVIKFINLAFFNYATVLPATRKLIKINFEPPKLMCKNEIEASEHAQILMSSSLSLSLSLSIYMYMSKCGKDPQKFQLSHADSLHFPKLELFRDVQFLLFKVFCLVDMACFA